MNRLDVIKEYPYMSKSKQERQTHLRLNEPCIVRISDSSFKLSPRLKGLLAFRLNTSLFKSYNQIYLAHACHNSQCSNWRHLYWAWSSENRQDRLEYENNPKPFVLSEEKFFTAEEYMKQSQEERQSHLRLKEPCLIVNRKGRTVSMSMYCRGLLADILNTEIFYKTKTPYVICHACHTGDCMNPYHMYWGTDLENFNDYMNNGGNTIWERVVNKYGLEKSIEMNANRRKKKIHKCP